jgi:hypothetical protein
MAVGDIAPFTFDFGSPGLASTGCGLHGSPPWTTAADPVTAATVTTSSVSGLAIVGTTGVSQNQVTAFLQANDSDQDFVIQCQVTTLLGRRATRVARVYVASTIPG